MQIDLVAKYEALWNRAEGDSLPNVFEYLKGHPHATSRQRADVLLCDQYRRWKRGEGIPAEQYLAECAEIAQDEELKLELIAEEFGYIEEASDTPDLRAFLDRFDLSESAQDSLKQMIGFEGTFDSINYPSRQQTPFSIDGRPRPTPTQIGRYQVLSKLGKGSFGVVYLANDDQLERRVAIKVPSRRHVKQVGGVDAFLKEARVVAGLDHANIVPVYDVGKLEDGQCYVVSKYIGGSDLKEKISSGISTGQTASLVATIARALHYAHKQGLVHRDIKPANILLDEKENPYVVDFGLALREEEYGQGEKLVGTPAYMSPEQAMGQGHLVDARSDIYSLGVVLYEMLTGRRPYRGNSSSEIIEQIRLGNIRPPRQMDDSVPRELDRICLHALARSPAERYSTALDFAEELEAFAESSDASSHVRPFARPEGTHPGSESRTITDSSSSTLPLRSTTEAQIQSDSTRNRWAHRVVSAVAVVTIAALGIWYYVQTNYGQVLIESPSDGVEVAIFRGEETFELVKAPAGETVVHLPVGNYRIELLGNLDRFQISREPNLAITRGAFVTVRVEAIDTPIATKPTAWEPDRSYSREEMAQKQLNAAKELDVEVQKDVFTCRMTFKLIPNGQFQMGSSKSEIDLLPLQDWFFKRWQKERMYSESPKHRVEISKPFYLSAYETTVGQFRTFVESTGYKTTAETDFDGGFGWRDGLWIQDPLFNWRNIGFEQGDDYPVNNVSWDDANEFCKWLSKREDAKFRLPTEAEWEYACRAGTTTWFYSGDRDEALKNIANIADQSLVEQSEFVTWGRAWNDGYPFTAPVGRFEPNALGLYDMHGNTWEWCSDWYSQTYYSETVATDPRGPRLDTLILAEEESALKNNRPPAKQYHVFRGGGWDNYPGFVRCADRYSSHSPTLRSQWAGFRVVLEVD